MTATNTPLPDLSGLKKVAEAAAPGPYVALSSPTDIPTDCCKFGVVSEPLSRETGRFWTREEAVFAATFDPPTVLALIAKVEALEGSAWVDDGSTPAVPIGRERYFIVAVRRAHNGKIYSFPALYLNNFPLSYDEEERRTTGWFGVEANEDGDGVTYQPILSAGDELVAWRPCPEYRAPANSGADQ